MHATALAWIRCPLICMYLLSNDGCGQILHCPLYKRYVPNSGDELSERKQEFVYYLFILFLSHLSFFGQIKVIYIADASN